MSSNNVKKIYLPTVLSTLIFLSIMAGAYVLVDSSLQTVFRPNRRLEEARYALAQTLQFVLDHDNPEDETHVASAVDSMALVTSRLTEISKTGRTRFTGLAEQSGQIQARLVGAAAGGHTLSDAEWKPLLQDLVVLQVRLELESQELLNAVKDRFYDAFDQLDLYVAASALLVVAMWLMNSFWLVPRYAVRPLEALLRAQREQEAHVRKSEAQMQAIANAVASGIVLAGEDGRIKFWNPSAERLLGCPREVALGAPLIDIVTSADGRPLPILADSPESGSRDHQVEEVLVRKRNGDNLAVSLYHTSATLDGSPHTVVVFRDVTEERQLQAELTKRHAELQALYENTPVMMGLVDETATIRFGNPAFIAYAGPENGSCLGMRLGDALGCVHAQGSAGGCGSSGACGSCCLRAVIRSTLEGGIHPHEFEHHALLRRDGQARPVTLLGTAVRLDAGDDARVLLCLQDITARKQTEEALRRSEERFRSYIEHAPIGVVVIDRTGHYLEANNAAGAHLGYTRDEMLTLNVRDLRVDSYEAAAEQHFKRVIHGENSTVELLLRRKDGSTVPTEVHASRLDEDRFLGFHVDLSERKKAESALLHQVALDAVLAEVSQAMVAEHHGVDMAGHILRHAMRLTGSSLSCVFAPGDEPGRVTILRPGQPALTFPSDEYDLNQTDPELPVLESLWTRLGRIAAPSTCEVPLPEPNGEPREDAAPARVLVLPIVQGDEWLGQIVLANASRDYSAADLTSLGRLAELYHLHMQGMGIRRELETSRQQFLQAQKMEAVGRLAGGVAHDFNNILGVILGYSEFALRNEACNNELLEHLECMRNAALRGADLTRQLLAFARKQTVQPRPLDLNENVGAMLKLLGRLAGERITVRWHPLNRPMPIEIDPSQLDQLLANLIVNARDAMAGSGTITIETAIEFIDYERGVLLGGNRKSGHFAVLSVTDAGCGMDVETLNHIFEPFYTTKPEGQGTGLGLATVHGIVHQNGGFVTAESEPGQGTTFRICLPIQEAADTGGVTHPESLKGDPSGSETILLVDDQGDFREACRTILQSLGYRVITARNGDEALRSLNGDTDKIQLLITDLVMPGMNGRDLWANLSARCPNLRCIYMSGYTADVIGEQGVLDESVCLIDKPFSMSTLAQRIREVLDA